MLNSVRIKFEKFHHDTGRAILVSINGVEYWLPKKLCRNIIVNKKLAGSVCIPVFLAEKIGFKVDMCEKDIEVIHHIPEVKQDLNIDHDKDLFR
jgi:hypothetical protein